MSLWRGGAQGRYQSYQVPLRENQTVLDVVTFVQRHLDPTLSYRFACRVGMCGSCAMTVNGRPRWTCRTHVSKVAAGGRLEIGPLENLPVIKDLATDMQPFFEKWQQAKGVFAPSKTRHDAIEQIRPDSARAHRRRCGDRMHQLRRLLRRLRYRALEFRLSRAGGAQSRLVARERRAGSRQTARACRRSRRPAAATPATRTSPARSTARRRSIRPPPSPVSSAAPWRAYLKGEIKDERPALCLAAAHRGGHGAAGRSCISRSSSTPPARA